MRISTSQFYTQNIELMNNQQSQLSELYQQVASGNTLLTAADDPLGAAQAVQLSASSATLAQYSSNQSSALSSLQLEDKTLSSVTNVLNAVIPSLSGAINGTLSDSDRSALAAQLQGQRDTLLQLANTTDGTGNYLFAGLQSGNQPFTNSPSGGVMFSGDTGQRTVQLSDSVSVAIGDSGARVFTSVPALGSLSVPASNPSNTGTGTIGVITGGTPGDPTNNHAFTVTFGGTTGAPTYTVTDNATTPPTVGTAQTYTAGSAISIGSQSMIISGNPAPGDSFTLTPATQAGGDMIGALDAAIAALKQPVGSGAAAGATLNNALSTALTKMQNAVANVTTVQASVGGREQEVKSMQTITSTNSLQITNSLTDLTQANMPAAITQLLQVQNSLTAAQQAFSKVQGPRRLARLRRRSPLPSPPAPAPRLAAPRPAAGRRAPLPAGSPDRRAVCPLPRTRFCRPPSGPAEPRRRMRAAAACQPPRGFVHSRLIRSRRAGIGRRCVIRPATHHDNPESPRWPIPTSRAGALPRAAPPAWSPPTNGCRGRRWWRWACSTWWRCSAPPCSRRC